MMIRQKNQLNVPPTQSGFTLIECLLAIVLVSLLMIAIAPAIAISVATRLQARRVEQATAAARTYIDGVRARKIETPADAIRVVDLTDRTTFAATAPPANNVLNCQPGAGIGNQYPYCTNTRLAGSLYCVDGDGNGCTSDSVQDFVVQAFRSATSLADDGSEGYLLGVRVYRADSFDGTTPLQSGRKVGAYAGGTGDKTAPVVEMTTEIRGSDTSYGSFCDRLGCDSTPGGTPTP